MAGELVDQIDPGKLYREASAGYDLVGSSALTGTMRGVSLQKINPGSSSGTPAVPYEYYNFLTTIPGNITMGTGLTFYLTMTDDGADSSDLSTSVALGITVKKLTSAVSADLSTVSAQEQTATVTLSATSGLTAQFTLAIGTGTHLNSAAVGDQIGVRVRRLGSSTADTCNGRVICLGGHIKNT